MPLAGFEPGIPASEQAKRVHALNRAATVIGSQTASVYVNLFGFHELQNTEHKFIPFYVLIFNITDG
jgi:hypothetical protein